MAAEIVRLLVKRKKLVFLGLAGALFLLFFSHHDTLANSDPSSFLPSSSTSGKTKTNTKPVTALAAIPETVHIVAAMSWYGSSEEGAMMIKSALMYQSTPITIHILVFAEAQEPIEKLFRLVTRPVHKVEIFFYPLTNLAIERRLDRAATGQGTDNPLMGAFRTNHYGGYLGLCKMFLHEIIPENVKRVIWLDTDAFFLSDPIITWRLFDTFGPETGIMMPSHDVFGEDEEPWQGASRVCSCVFLMDLEVLRRKVYMYSTIFSDEMKAQAIGSDAVLKVWGPPIEPPYYKNLQMGDQAYFWATKVVAPEIFMHLPLSFEVTWCLWDSYGVRLAPDTANMTIAEQKSQQKNLVGTPDEDNLIIPHILHFNCVFGRDEDKDEVDIYFQRKFWLDPTQWLTQLWGPAVMYHGQYKFIWLNKGHSTLTMTTVPDLRFWDERLAGREWADGY